MGSSHSLFVCWNRLSALPTQPGQSLCGPASLRLCDAALSPYRSQEVSMRNPTGEAIRRGGSGIRWYWECGPFRDRRSHPVLGQ